jgi:hypothetical protein
MSRRQVWVIMLGLAGLVLWIFGFLIMGMAGLWTL